MTDRLKLAAGAFMAANLLHTADHFRQGTGRLNWEILAGGTAITVGAAITLWLVLREHPRAPVWAAVLGFWSAAGIAASHLAPHWSVFSDPYPDLDVDALSWAIVLLEIGTALWLGVVGARALTRLRTAASP